MNECISKWVNEWLKECTNELMLWMNVLTYKLINILMNKWKNECTNEQLNEVEIFVNII